MHFLKTVTLFGIATAVVSTTDLDPMFKELKAEDINGITEDRLLGLDIVGTLLDGVVGDCQKNMSKDPACKAFVDGGTSFKNGKLTAEELKTFLTETVAPMLKRVRNQEQQGKSYRWLMEQVIGEIKQSLGTLQVKPKPDDVKIVSDHLLAIGESMDDLNEKTEEMGKKMDSLFKEQAELVTCKSVTRVLLALHNYKPADEKGTNIWLIVGIIGGVVGGLVIIGLLVYFFWWRPKKAAF